MDITSILLLKVGSGCCHSKVNKRGKLVERKVCFILDAARCRWHLRQVGWTPVQRPTPPYTLAIRGKSFYRWREEATCKNGTVSFDSHLEIGHMVN